MATNLESAQIQDTAPNVLESKALNRSNPVTADAYKAATASTGDTSRDILPGIELSTDSASTAAAKPKMVQQDMIAVDPDCSGGGGGGDFGGACFAPAAPASAPTDTAGAATGEADPAPSDTGAAVSPASAPTDTAGPATGEADPAPADTGAAVAPASAPTDTAGAATGEADPAPADQDSTSADSSNKTSYGTAPWETNPSSSVDGTDLSSMKDTFGDGNISFDEPPSLDDGQDPYQGGGTAGYVPGSSGASDPAVADGNPSASGGDVTELEKAVQLFFQRAALALDASGGDGEVASGGDRDDWDLDWLRAGGGFGGW